MILALEKKLITNAKHFQTKWSNILAHEEQILITSGTHFRTRWNMILSLINEPPLLAEQKLVHEEQIMITEGTQLHTKWKKVLVHEKQIPSETQF